MENNGSDIKGAKQSDTTSRSEDSSGYSTCSYAYSVPVATRNTNGDRGFECAQSRYSTENFLKRTESYDSTTSHDSKCSLLSRTSEILSKNRCVTGLICFFVVFTVVCVSLIVVLFLMLYDLQEKFDDEASERKREANTFCVPCNDLILGPLEEDNKNLEFLLRETKDGVDECCAKGSNQTSVLIDLLFKRREKLNQAQDTIASGSNCKCNSSSDSSEGNSVKISAHLLAGVQSTTNTGDSPYTVHNWTSTSPIAHATGIQFSDSRIIVNTSGLYQVYSQIFFSNLYKVQSTINTSQALYHYVYRWNIIYPNDGNELLLKSVRTQCWAENRVYGDYTSYTAGVFKLNVGDNLYVKASKIDLMSRDPHASFFGIVKL